MSIEAVGWALADAPGVLSSEVSTLVGLANHADPDGEGAFPSRKRLAKYARKTPEAVSNSLAGLRERKLAFLAGYRPGYNVAEYWLPVGAKTVEDLEAAHARFVLKAQTAHKIGALLPSLPGMSHDVFGRPVRSGDETTPLEAGFHPP